MEAAQYGIHGNGVVDDAPAFQALLKRAAIARASVTLARGSTLRLESSIDVPSNTHLVGNGASLLNAAAGSRSRILSLDQVENVIIEQLVLDGRKSEYSATTEQRHNIALGGATNVVIRSVHSSNAKGDGLYIGDVLNGPSVGVIVEDSVFDLNHRQGMSITCASGVTVTGCTFSRTAGTAPSAGVDIEPNTDTDVLENLKFVSCTFSGNVGGGLQVYLRLSPKAVQQAGSFMNCTFAKNASSPGVILMRSRGANFSGGTISDNGSDGVSIYAASHTSIDSVTIAANGGSGVNLIGSYTDLVIEQTLFDGNGKVAAHGGWGVLSSPSAGSRGVDLRASNNTFRNMYGGIQTNSTCSHVTLSGNTFAHLTVSEQLSDDAASRSNGDRT